MKLFWAFFTIFYAIIHQEHLATTAEGSLDDFSTNDFLPDVEQKRLLNDFADQIIAILKDMNTPEFSLEDDDLPLVQDYTNIAGDQLLDGNLLMRNIIIDGLDEIEDSSLNIAHDEREIHMAVNLKQLMIDGEFTVETFTDGIEEKGPFSVTLTNVRIKGVAYLIANPSGNLVITKVVPTVSSEESHVSLQSETAPCVQILKSALTHLQNTIEKRFAKVAMRKVHKYHPEESAHLLSKETLAMFEVRRFMSQRYDPLTFSSTSERKELTPHLYQFRHCLHGFSNIHLNETVMFVTDNSVTIMGQILVESLHGNFSFFLPKRYLGSYSIEKIDFIGTIKLTADNSLSNPKIERLGMQMSGCRCSIRNKATGMLVDRNEFGFDAEDTICLLIRGDISTKGITETIQNEILNHVDLKRLEDSLGRVIHENSPLEAY